jgi:hypothetical protein
MSSDKTTGEPIMALDESERLIVDKGPDAAAEGEMPAVMPIAETREFKDFRLTPDRQKVLMIFAGNPDGGMELFGLALEASNMRAMAQAWASAADAIENAAAHAAGETPTLDDVKATLVQGFGIGSAADFPGVILMLNPGRPDKALYAVPMPAMAQIILAAKKEMQAAAQRGRISQQILGGALQPDAVLKASLGGNGGARRKLIIPGRV